MLHPQGSCFIRSRVVLPWHPHYAKDVCLYPCLRTTARARGAGTVVEGLSRMLKVLGSISSKYCTDNISDSRALRVRLSQRLKGRL